METNLNGSGEETGVKWIKGQSGEAYLCPVAILEYLDASGIRAEVLVVDNGAPEPQQPGDELFAEPRAIAAGLSGDNASITVTDINGDGRMDLFVAGASSAEGRYNSLFIANGDGNYSPDDAHPLAGIDRVNAALWGDIDNDGIPEIVACHRDGRHLR